MGRLSNFGFSRLLVLAGILCLALPSFAGSPEPEKVVEVTIYKMRFDPAEITIEKGTTVRWINKEKRQYHNVWFEALGEEEPDYLFPGDVYERRFDEAGDFPYRCGPHEEMRGIVHVRDE